MKLFYDSKKITLTRVFWHLLFWLSYLFFYGSVYGSLMDDFVMTYIEVSIYIPVRMAATYFTVYALISRYLLNRKYVEFVGFFLVSVAFFGLVQGYIYQYITFPLFRTDYTNENIWDWPIVFKGIINIYSVAAIAAAIKLWKQWYQNQQINQQLITENLEAELKMLKAQVHPHFLFNTLNNLYALTLKKSDTAPDVVLKLSELMNYMLYESNTKKVSIEKEIKMVKDYIDLEKLRYGHRLDVKIEVHGINSSIQIPPMLIFPFVENCFKHGISTNIDQSFIKLKLDCTNGQIRLNVSNNKSCDNPMDIAGYQEGIGLKNVARRLELLYKDKHKLELFDTENEFIVDLHINTNDKME